MSLVYASIIGDIVLTKERAEHIFTFHPELERHIKEFPSILQNSDIIRRSKHDKAVLLFYKYFASIKGGKYIMIAVKTNDRNFILTAYITDKIKAGEKYETEKKSF